MSAVVAGMAALGDEDGKAVALEYRYAEGKLDQLPLISRNLIEQNVKVIVAVAGEALVAAAQVTNTVLIVSPTAGGDFVSMGLIKSWDRPGTNVTGMNLIADEAAAARVEILRKVLPVGENPGGSRQPLGPGWTRPTFGRSAANGRPAETKLDADAATVGKQKLSPVQIAQNLRFEHNQVCAAGSNCLHQGGDAGSQTDAKARAFLPRGGPQLALS